ncbi:hypothetical protein Dimus_015737, partial [Dionaea muscipula]
LSSLSGHSLRRSLRMDATRKKYRWEMRKIKAELKEDVINVTKVRQTVEEENKQLKTELEKKKAKRKRSRERLVLLHIDLSDRYLKSGRLHNELNETSQKLIKIVEKRHLVKARLPKQLDYMTKEAQRTYLNGWRLGLAQVRRMLDDDDPLIPELDQLEINIKVPFQQEKIKKIEKKPAEWTEAYDAGVFTTIEEWGKEIEEMFPMPPTSEMSNLALHTPTTPKAPSTSDAPLLSSELNAPPYPTKNEELYETQLRLSEADGTIQTLYCEMNDLGDRWAAKTEFIEGELEKVRAFMTSYAILEDTSTSSLEKQIEDPSPIIVEDPISTIIMYEPPPKFEEEDRETV